VIVDAGEHVGEPGLRIDVVEPRSLDQRVHHGGALAAAIGAGEQPGLASERDAAQRTLGRIVGETDPSVIEEAREGVPASEHIVHRLGDIAVAREPAIFRAQPGLELRYQRRDARAAHREALVNGTAVDLALDVEDRIDALHRFEGKRRDDRELAARFGSHVGELEELAATVRPAARLGDRPRLSVGTVIRRTRMQLMSLARWLARKAVTAEWRAEGRKVQYIEAREITEASNAYLEHVLAE